MKKIAVLISFLAIFSTVSAEGFSFEAFFNKLKFASSNPTTYSSTIQFGGQDILFLKSLSSTSIQKLVNTVVFVKTKEAQNKANEAAASSTASTTPVRPPIPQIPQSFLGQLLSPYGGSSQPRPPAYSGASGLNDSDPSSNPSFRPSSAPQDGPARRPLTSSEMANFSELPPAPAGSCPNFGVNGNMNNIIPKIKFDTNCLCIAFGGQIKMVSGHRPGDPRNHGQGLAIDIAENNYKDRQKDALFVVALIGLNYNIGSYHPGFGSFHADRENSGRWKTWSGVAHTNYSGSYARNYYQQVQDALNLIGMPAQSAAQFRSTYGNPSQASMSAKAKSYIESNGSDTLKKCLQGSVI